MCPLAAIAPIPLDLLLSDSSYFVGANISQQLTTRANYAPLRGGDSLRLTVWPDDQTLIKAEALNVTLNPSSDIHSFDPTKPPVLSSTVFALMVRITR